MLKFKNLIYSFVQRFDIDLKSLNNRLLKLDCRHAEASAVFSTKHKSSQPTNRLLSIFSKLITESSKSSTFLFKERQNVPEYVYDFPGEHYLILQALVKIINAKTIVEIGTYTGLSSLSFFHVMDKSVELYSFDIVKYDKFENSVLRKEDFENYNFQQIISDLSDLNNLHTYKNIIQKADLIFCDGPKDGSFERVLLKNFEKLRLKEGVLIFFDDIRQWNMLEIWSNIKMPKIDITSIGHFSGTGIVEWENNKNCF